jgi:hypothetical protein
MNNKSPKGFSGLSQLHSKSEDKTDSHEPNTQPGSQPDNTLDVDSESEVQVAALQDKKQEGEKSGLNWAYVFGFLFIVGIFMAISQDNNSPSSVPKATTGSSLANLTTTDGKTPATPHLESSPDVGKANTQKNKLPKAQYYNKPPVGSNNVLSVSQIRWCTREMMRIDTMRNIFETNGGIDEFTRIVKDYNSRCGSYRYRQGDLSRAEREVETYRSTITNEAIREAKQIEQRFKKNSNVSKETSS